jgi:lipopolysaccharide transport system ATP-binding protein
MTYAIEVENLSKKYLIYHENQGAYSTIVDSLTRGAKRMWQTYLHPFRKGKKPPVRSSEEFWALRDVNLSFAQGDRIGILGKNGAGKSTLLKILSRIVEPTEGRIKIRGRMASLLEVGTGFHPELTGRENIYLNGAILGMGRQEIRKKFNEIVTFSEIEKFLDTPVKYYSSGMYARLGFAIAAHLDPEILIVDEVLAVGDATFQAKCLSKMQDQSRAGRTVIFVSHNTAAILQLCNQGILLENGRIKAAGAIEPCIDAYIKTYRPDVTSWSGDAGDGSLRIKFAEFQMPFKERHFYYTDETAVLRISGEVAAPLTHAVLGIEVRNKRETLIAHSFLNEQERVWKKFNQKGAFQLDYALPVHYFPEGEYNVSIVYFIPNKHLILKEQIQLKLLVYRAVSDSCYVDASPKEGVVFPPSWALL